MAEKTLSIKKDTLWKIGTIVFAVLFIISLVWNPFGRGTGEVITGDTSKEQMCSSIRGTPAWADSEGVIIDYGYKETYAVDDLIEDKTYFLYNPG